MCETAPEKEVLAMYDVRGIQKYIFRTARVKDAIGASWIVENIILEALRDAEKKIGQSREVKVELKWCDEERWFYYPGEDKDIQVLFVGGGNAVVMYSSEELCVEINRLMARYILEKTYSLQLAVAIVGKGNSYAKDYRKLYAKMNQTKANMVISKPLGTLPVMDMEIKTGYPKISKDESTETKLKRESGTQKQRDILQKEEKVFDSYVTKKGVDSTIAVVHIDGNSMGQRIRERISGIEDYAEAVNTMRELSFHINYSYKKVFSDMKAFFSANAGKMEAFQAKETPYFIREILVAGDDITFVCNGKIALAAVEYYCRQITRYTMNGKNDEESIRKYGFSVCAGVAYMKSHFPFSIGYEVAEACCETAKERAKKSENMDGERVGNFVDFHICKNIQAQSFQHMRMREYVTSNGEQLLIRPYYIRTEAEGDLGRLNGESFAFDKLKAAVSYFQNEKNIPKSFAKELRNTYALGEDRINLFYSFLESRGWEMPDKKDELYIKEGVTATAKWYDALEIQDYYVDLDAVAGEEV